MSDDIFTPVEAPEAAQNDTVEPDVVLDLTDDASDEDSDTPTETPAWAKPGKLRSAFTVRIRKES